MRGDVLWTDPRLESGWDDIIARKTVALAAVTSGIDKLQAATWRAFFDSFAHQDVISRARGLYERDPGGRVGGTGEFFRSSVLTFRRSDPAWQRQLHDVDAAHIRAGITDPADHRIYEHLEEQFMWVAGSVIKYMQRAAPPFTREGIRRHWSNVAGEMGLRRAPATQKDLDAFLQQEEEKILDRPEHPKTKEVAHAFLPRVLTITKMTRDEFVSGFNPAMRERLGI